ncbi:MAG: iron ABC transporter permease [Bacteroidales bacterium]|nr:iron ABC transporter permease [Bacteroidales bacterium]
MFRNIIWLVIIVLLFAANLWFGSVPLQWDEVLSILQGQITGNSVAEIIVLQFRLPQATTAMAVGVALSVAGLLLQTTFANPLAGPSVLGVSSGASFGVALVLLFGGATGIQLTSADWYYREFTLVAAALAGALAVLSIIVVVSSRIGNSVTVLIIGIMIGYLVNAAVGTLQFYSNSQDLQAYVLWGLGSFSKTTVVQSLLLLASVLLIAVATLSFVKPLNAMLLGESYARSSGFNTRMLNRTFIFISGLFIALGTAFTGPIAFLGLAVPHLARTAYNTSDHRILLPAVMLIGAALSLSCNLIARLPGWDSSLPINAVTSVIGAPIVIWVIVKARSYGR